MADLITLDEYKEYLGKPDQAAPDDGQVTALIPAASNAVRKFTDRKFELAGTPATREFEYDGSGILDIDECLSITAVESDLGYTNAGLYPLDVTEWLAQPGRETPDDDPYYYLLLNSIRLPASPEMGFTRNLDKLGYAGVPPTIAVTATWGWDQIPPDVKLATAIIVQDLKRTESEAGGGTMTSEAIAGYSRSWAVNPANSLAIPNRARDLLLNYQRVYG